MHARITASQLWGPKEAPHTPLLSMTVSGACAGPSHGSKRHQTEIGEVVCKGHLQCSTLLRVAAHTEAAMGKCGALTGVNRTPRTSQR